MPSLSEQPRPSPETGKEAGADTHSRLVAFSQRPHRVSGSTYRAATPGGTAFITVNHDLAGEPFEVFITVGKAGSETQAVAEALGRAASLLLRFSSPIPARERLQALVSQWRRIGSDQAIGFGPESIRSLPDAVAGVLQEYLETTPGEKEDTHIRGIFGLLCPSCGRNQATRPNGLLVCRSCGYREA